MICPNCGFEQPESPECPRCGIIFSKFRARGQPPDLPPPGGEEPAAFAAAYGRPFEVGSVLGDTFRIYFANLFPFLVIAAVALSPLFLVALFGVHEGDGPPTGVDLAVMLTAIFVGSVLGPYVATAAITFGVVQHLRGRDASVGECLGRGLAVLFPVLGVAVLTALAVGVGLMLCIIPGVIIAVQLAVAVPAAVEERPGVLASLHRSADLTAGYRWQVFLVLLVLGLLAFVLGFVLALATGVEGDPTELPTLLLNVVTTALSAAAAAVIYYRLRSAKESIDLEHLTSVFD